MSRLIRIIIPAVISFFIATLLFRCTSYYEPKIDIDETIDKEIIDGQLTDVTTLSGYLWYKGDIVYSLSREITTLNKDTIIFNILEPLKFNILTKKNNYKNINFIFYKGVRFQTNQGGQLLSSGFTCLSSSFDNKFTYAHPEWISNKLSLEDIAAKQKALVLISLTIESLFKNNDLEAELVSNSIEYKFDSELVFIDKLTFTYKEIMSLTNYVKDASSTSMGELIAERAKFLEDKDRSLRNLVKEIIK